MDKKRGPGRPPKTQEIGVQRGETQASHSPAMAESNPGVVTGDRETNAHGINRHNRVSMGGAMKSLTLPASVQQRLESENRHAHYVRDDNRGRLQQAINAGYEHVVDEQGNNISRRSGPGTLYLMSIPNEWHEDDKALKRQKAAASLGKEATLGEGEYSPTGQQSAVKTSESREPI